MPEIRCDHNRMGSSMEEFRILNHWAIAALHSLGVDQSDVFVEWCNSIGAPFILIPFILLQTGLLKPGIVFSVLNAIGGSLFLLFFIVKWGPGGIVLESFFVLFALWGIVRGVAGRPALQKEANTPI
jgi:hypothetical protein